MGCTFGWFLGVGDLLGMGFERRLHEVEVGACLERTSGTLGWSLALPRGSGQETYVAYDGERRWFIKVGADVGRVLAMSEVGLCPPVVGVEALEDRSVVVVQEFIDGKHPDRLDYRERLENVARIVGEMHRAPGVLGVLLPVVPEGYAEAGIRAVGRVQARWEQVRDGAAAEVADFVEASLDRLEQKIGQFEGDGLVASHGDICWDNWIFATDGRIYLVDLDAMGLDDPALDLGALLWWYYPPELWGRFLGCAGYQDIEQLRERMWVRLALHCLSITLPGPGSFDIFDPATYPSRSGDFRAAPGREGNPELS